MEKLDRGLVAVRTAERGVFLSWRLLGSDPQSVKFNVYRQSQDGPIRRNATPISDSTNYLVAAPLEERESKEGESLYFVRAVVDDTELPPCNTVSIWERYLEIAIRPIEGYRPGDASVGDLDGDGQYEIVLHQVCRPRDNSHAGLTGTPILDAYKLDGTHLWRIDLGHNIREGEHYTQSMVYDFDGDGLAEVACKTADGSEDGLGSVIGDASKEYRVTDDTDKRFGRVLSGPEFLTIFDGRTGRALKTVDYVPSREPIDAALGETAGTIATEIVATASWHVWRIWMESTLVWLCVGESMDAP